MVCGMVTKPPLKANQVIVGIIKALIHIGIIKIGFKATGAPYTNGSLILKIDGTNAICPNLLILFHFERIIMIFNAKVIPIPPIKTTEKATFGV